MDEMIATGGAGYITTDDELEAFADECLELSLQEQEQEHQRFLDMECPF